MMEKMDNDKKQFADLLSKAVKPQPSLNLTSNIMAKIQVIDVKNKIYRKYIRWSWFFIVVAVLLSIKAVSNLVYFELTFEPLVDAYLPGAMEFFVYTLLSSLAGLFLYQLNSLLSYKIA